ncbi:putative membrane protein [Desulfosarcina variabilis str. Montpellier]
MLSSYKKSLFNILLKAFILLSKFFFISSLANHYSTVEIGQYCLFLSSVMIGTLLIGFDFYSFNTREIISLKPIKIIDAIRDQLAFHLLSYLISVPFLFLFFNLDIIPKALILWFIVILFSEHICTELHRFLIIFRQPISANINQFLRSSLWMLIITLLLIFDFRVNMLSFIFCSWLFGNLICFIFSIYSLRSLPWKFFFNKKIDFYRILNGLKSLLPIYISSIFLKIVEYSDRFFINYYSHSSSLGIYFFFASITNVIQSFTYAGVISIFLPQILNAYQSQEKFTYKILILKMLKGTFIICLFISIILVIFILPFLNFINGQIYIQNIKLFYLMLFSNSIISIGLIPHFLLYSQNKDYPIMYSSLLSGLSIILLHIVFIPKFGIFGAVFSNIIGASTTILIKFGFIKTKKLYV